MASLSEADPRLNEILIPSLEKIIKNASWRKGHSKLAQQCKAVIERLSIISLTVPSSHSESLDSSSSLPGPLSNLSLAESEAILTLLISACSSSFLKIAEPALDCVQRLISHALLHGEVDPSAGPSAWLLAQLIDASCSCHSLADDSLELLVIKALLSAVTSSSIHIHGDSLLLIVRTIYDIYLATTNSVNQTTAKASLIQILVVIFCRMEADSSTVPVQPIVVADLMQATADRPPADGNVTKFVQGFITKVIGDIDGVFNSGSTPSTGIHDITFESTAVENTNPADLLDSTDKDMLDAKYWEISMYKTALEGRKDELRGDSSVMDAESNVDDEFQVGNRLKRDAFLVFRALCKLSMKTPPKEALADSSQMKGKIVALEMLKILLENAGTVFRTNERFLGAIKQYLCLSLLKNSASPLMIIFQLSCSIFMSLLSRFRPGLKAETGVFFPMIILRVLENVAQPYFQQKMTVLRFLEKLCIDSQILVDIFVNYDSDGHSPNIFERMVKGLLKTAQGAPSGAATNLAPTQDAMLKLEAMRCLVAILKSMEEWMNKQMRLSNPRTPSHIKIVSENVDELPMENGNIEAPVEGEDSEQMNGGFSEAAAALEVQEGISLFNRNPKNGIQFLIRANKVGNSPEELAYFLKNSSGLNKVLIGDYLGEREELSLKVLHSYVDAFDFHDVEIDDALRDLLQGFRLPRVALKIDRIMEKFAEHYFKCNPNIFTSADTAYVLTYSIIMLNIDAHNPMNKNKMTVDDFISNNYGIDDAKDLPELYLRSLHERISRKEIVMEEDYFSSQQQQSLIYSKKVGLDKILNVSIYKWGGKTIDSLEDIIRHMREQFRDKACKSEDEYCAATDVMIMRFMMEVCWAPMLAAFSVALDQTNDLSVLSACIEGFMYAIHVTSAMSMKTQRDAFVTSLAKFTSLHSAADIKQKNIDAIKAIILIADEDGHFLQDAWDHVLTCISRLEHLHFLGGNASQYAVFSAIRQSDSDKSKSMKSSMLPMLKNKGPGRLQQVAAASRRGSYESASVGGHASGMVTSDQMSNLVSNLHLLEQVGMPEMNHIFLRSQDLNSEAIIDFVKALCKVSMEELRSIPEPRVFSLIKVTEIAHYNMNRIRLVWSSIWKVLSSYFVTIGCSDNLSISIFAMDSLRQIGMKYLDHEELANYNFQNEFMRPFVIVMRKSRAVEIRELIIRCVSQMVFSRVKSIKSGWRSLFMVFTTASCDARKNIVILAFEILEKIIKDYFPYITDTENTTFTNCVNCLISFTNSSFSKDFSGQAISFLLFCATKLADGAFGKDTETPANNILSSQIGKKDKPNTTHFTTEKDRHLLLWFPLLAGLSELCFDMRAEIRKNALQALFNTLETYGHLFTLPLWERVLDSVLFPLFDYVRHAIDPSGENIQREEFENNSNESDQDSLLYETCKLSLDLVVDIFVKFYDTVNPLLRRMLVLLTSFIKRPHQSLAGIGITAFSRLITTAGSLLKEERWLEVALSLKEAAVSTVPEFSFISSDIFFADIIEEKTQISIGSGTEGLGRLTNDDFEEQARALYFALTDVRCRVAVQLLLIQAVMKIINMYRHILSSKNSIVFYEGLHGIALHAHKINTDNKLRSRLLDLGPMTQMQEPPLLRLENESYHMCLNLLQIAVINSSGFQKTEATILLVDLCAEIIQVYIDIAKVGSSALPAGNQVKPLWQFPTGSSKRSELTARATVVVEVLNAICGMETATFKQYLAYFFPLFSCLICCEHGSNEMLEALCNMLGSKIGPILLPDHSTL